MSRTSMHLIRGADTRRRCVEARLAGKTYDQIASEVGISKQVAHRYVCRALREVAERAAEDADALRRIELDRLEALHATVWPTALEGDLASIATALRISERRSKLLALDGPVRAEVSGPGGEPLALSAVSAIDYSKIGTDDLRTVAEILRRARREPLAEVGRDPD